ncbi:MAG: DUF3575 domain-containing protein [Chitinophagaceae bacterium]|jgi:hypothetical protein|nr:DUF3575 domain-containing protein [Chitinophagaceae bacterium]
MKYTSILLLVFLTLQVNAQNEKLTKNVLSVTFLDPGIAFETSLSNHFTAKFRTGITGTFQRNYVVPNQQYAVFVRSFISASGRYYYNFKKRTEKGKNTDRNSANYIAVLGIYGFSSFTENDPIYLIESTRQINAGVVWGMQRNYKNRFSLDLNLGVGYLGTPVTNNFGLMGEFTLGIWLGKKTG